ncbi:MAG: ATP-dependent Clp protease ATP-binding subunit, partial [Actinomycetota bacterium]|nr:ATP-dependent Clp protease ATP-binding subunit [Actinomycetota bacterium]
AVRDAQVPVSAICQSALERAVRDVSSLRAVDEPPPAGHPLVGMLGRFTPRVTKSLALAEKEARAVPHGYVGTEHLLLGMMDEGGNLGIKVLEALDIELADLRSELVASMGPGGRGDGSVPFTPLAKQAIERAAKEALGMFHNYVGCEHLLLGLVATEEGLASQVLRRMGVELRTARRAVATALTGFLHAQQSPKPARPEAGDTLQQILRRLDAIEQRLAG